MTTTGGSIIAEADSVTDKEVAKLIQRSAEANAALLRKDVDQYRGSITLSEDFTLMSPFGGTPRTSRRCRRDAGRRSATGGARLIPFWMSCAIDRSSRPASIRTSFAESGQHGMGWIA